MKALLTVLLIAGATSASAFGWTDVINEGIANQIASDNAQTAAEAALEADMEKYWYCYDRGLTRQRSTGMQITIRSQLRCNSGLTHETYHSNPISSCSNNSISY